MRVTWNVTSFSSSVTLKTTTTIVLGCVRGACVWVRVRAAAREAEMR